MESNIATFLVTCFVATGIITGTSLVLVNSVGNSLYRRKDGNYIFRTEQSYRLRNKISGYPNIVFFMYLYLGVILAIMAICNEFEMWKIGNMIEWGMACFSALYFIWILYNIRDFCSGAFDAFGKEE